MARIAGVNLPNQKRLEIGLTYIYGIGRSTAQKICSELGLDPNEKVRDLTDEEVTKLRGYIDTKLEVEGDLRRERSQAIKRLSEIGCYRGVRHRRGPGLEMQLGGIDQGAVHIPDHGAGSGLAHGAVLAKTPAR